MIETLPVAVGVGLAVSLLFSEMFGLAAGGMVVPGYVAVHLNRPLDVALTLAAGFATFAIVRLLSVTMIVYGRRRTVLMILVGYLIGMLVRMTPAIDSVAAISATDAVEVSVVGYIIPGLIGIWIDRQGAWETCSVLLTAAVTVRLILILFGLELLA